MKCWVVGGRTLTTTHRVTTSKNGRYSCIESGDAARGAKRQQRVAFADWQRQRVAGGAAPRVARRFARCVAQRLASQAQTDTPTHAICCASARFVLRTKPRALAACARGCRLARTFRPAFLRWSLLSPVSRSLVLCVSPRARHLTRRARTQW